MVRRGRAGAALIARTWFAVTALVVLIGLVVQISAAIDQKAGHFRSTHAKVFNVFCFFTIQSNVLVMVTCALLALGLHRRSTLFWVLRLDGVVCIVVTFVVFHVALSGLRELSGKDAVADFLLHTASPVLAFVGWLIFGPRGRVSARVVRLAVVFPVAWLVFTLVRGPIVDFYPYPFLDVDEHGYPRVLLNCALVAVFFVGLLAVAHVADKKLPRLMH